MNARTLLFLSTILPSLVEAQDEYLTLWGGAVADRLNLPSFDAFRTSFDRVNKDFAEEELGAFGTSLGWQAGATLMLTEHIGFSLCYMAQRSNTEVSFTDGSTRYFRHDLFTPINGGPYFLAGRIEIHPRLGFCQAEMRSWTEYPDGTASYGQERLLNGVYRTFGLFYGSELGVRIKFGDALGIAFGGSWFALSGSDYSEPNLGRSMNLDPFYPQFIPMDYELWLDLAEANDLTAYEVDEYVKLKGSWYGLYVNLTVDLK